MNRDDFWGDAGFGIVRSRRHLAYGGGHGALLWAPPWVKTTIIVAWNWIVCHTIGHDTFGPWDEDEWTLFIDGIWTRTHPKTCSACSRTWWEWKRERPRRPSRTRRHREAIKRAWRYRQRSRERRQP
jgi:hypothetical protein